MRLRSGNLRAFVRNHDRMSIAGREPPDTELVRRAAEGDRDAYAAIYRRYRAVVYRFARMMTGSDSMAEDVTQEVFIALLRDVSRYEPQRSGLATYLYAVARNVSRGALRRERRFVELDPVDPKVQGAVSPGDPASALEHMQQHQRLRRAILTLPSRYREVVILCDVHGLSYAETAGIVGVPIGTVRSRLFRARHLLGDRLGSDPRVRDATVPRSMARCLA